MADGINTKTMHTDLSTWVYDEKLESWKGFCKECKGEKAKYTPDVRVRENIKPCSICSTIKKE